MNFILQLAFKNLLRYRKRTIITSAALAAGIAIYVLMDSMVAGSMDMSEDNMIRYEMAHGKVTADSWWEEKDYFPLRESLSDGVALSDRITEADGIKAAPRTTFMADMIVYRDPYPEDGSMQVLVTGIDPERDGRVFSLEDTLHAGRWLEPGEEGALLGRGIAHDIGADIGYPLTLVCRTRDGYYQTIDLEVVGILDTPNPMVNRMAVMMPLDTADYALDQMGAVTEISVQLPGGRAVKKADVEFINSLLPEGLSFHSWKEMAQDYLGASAGDQYGTAIILFLVFIIAAVGVSNTMLMAVLERTRELGMMRAMGMTVRDIKRLFVYEAAGIGLLGSTAGVVIGILGNIPMVRRGIPLPADMDNYNVGYRISGVMWGVWNPEIFLLSVVVGTVITILVTKLSIRRIMKYSIVEDLRHI